jgi:hypothetical protein
MKVSKPKIIISLTFLFFSFILFAGLINNSYSFYKFYNKNFSGYLGFRSLAAVGYELDVKKSFLPRGFNGDTYSINLELDAKDLENFQNYYHSVLTGQDNFMPDAGKEWRKAKVILENRGSQSVKVKIHGTSYGPIEASLPLLSKLKFGFTKEVRLSDIDVSRAGYSLKIEINKEDEYFKGIRSLNLLSPYDDWTLAQSAFNRYFASHDIISSKGSLINLYINGQDIGPYLGVEKIGKELLERDHKITNFALLKSNDDWNKGFLDDHRASTDFTAFDKEQSGEEPAILAAQSKLHQLLEAIEEENFQIIFDMVDIENLAKVASVYKLSGSSSPLYGDNVKYIYDFATGKFKFAFTLESALKPLTFFQPAYFDYYAEEPFPPHKLILLLLTKDWFIEKRNKFLAQIVESQDSIVALFQSEIEADLSKLSKTRFSTVYYRHSAKDDLQILRDNLNIIESYLSYAKIYSTIEINDNYKYKARLLHDSFTESTLLSAISCQDEKHEFPVPVILPPGNYDNEMNILISSAISFESPFSCIKSLDVRKSDLAIKIDDKHIYFNFSQEIRPYSPKGLEQLGDGLKKSVVKNQLAEKFQLLPGEYVVSSDIFFPIGASLEILPGTIIKIDPKVSILLKGDFIALGSKDAPIVIKKNQDSSFGAFAIIGNNSRPSNINTNYFFVSGGSESVLDGIYFSGQFAAHIAKVKIENSIFENSVSDDGINIKFSSVVLKNNIFRDNFADQVDLDYVTGEVTENKFLYSASNLNETDGLDISGSNLIIQNNLFSNMTDKGLSVGEKSIATISSNKFLNNNLGIAAKDGSSICIDGNIFEKNNKNIVQYIKKKMYSQPNIYSKNEYQNKIHFIDQNSIVSINRDNMPCNKIFLTQK